MENISIVWANPDKTVVLITYENDGWGWQDLYEAVKAQKEFIESVSHPKVDVIIDCRKTGIVPKGGSILTGIRKVTVEHHPRQGHTILVGAHGFPRAMLKVAEKLMGTYRQEFISVDTMEAAYALIHRLTAQRDVTLTRR
jgi:hypothetical protein